MNHCADYIAAAKAALGDPGMSDEQLGQRLGYTQQIVNRAKRGTMSDPMALRLAELLGIEAGEMLLVARAERERDPAVSAALLAYVGKILGATAKKATAAGLAPVVLLASLLMPPTDALAEREAFA